jgi:2-desacetyl-2-hydroxyethyl bacteriochlorophyllide A dehydrogenase
VSALAAYVTALGGPEQIRIGELPVAELGPTDVLVRTEALEVNRVDTLVRSGAYPTPTPFPFIIGRDLVGTVVSAGPGAAGFRAGDRVWSNSLGHGGRQGSFSQLAVVAAERLYHLPSGIDAVDAVAVVHGAGTACLGLFRDASIGPAETVVIGGGAGAVGSAAVQLAARAGARVLATAAPRDAEWCRAAGAHEVFDYRDPALVELLRDAAAAGADVYWDTSGHQDLEAILPLLAKGARVIVTAAAHARPTLPVQAYYTRDISVRTFAISNASTSDLATAARIVNARLADGTLKARVGARLPLSEAADAHRRLEAGGTDGRIVVLP